MYGVFKGTEYFRSAFKTSFRQIMLSKKPCIHKWLLSEVFSNSEKRDKYTDNVVTHIKDNYLIVHVFSFLL